MGLEGDWKVNWFCFCGCRLLILIHKLAGTTLFVTGKGARYREELLVLEDGSSDTSCPTEETSRSVA